MLPDCALDDPLDEALDDALAVELVLCVCVAASVENATKLLSVTPRITSFSARTLSRACALGMRGAAIDLGVRGAAAVLVASCWTRAGRVSRYG